MDGVGKILKFFVDFIVVEMLGNDGEWLMVF